MADSILRENMRNIIRNQAAMGVTPCDDMLPMAGCNLSALNTLIDQCKKKSSMTIGERVSPAGFKELQITAWDKTGRIREDRLGRFIEGQLQSVMFAGLEQTSRDAIASGLETFMLSEHDAPDTTKFAAVNFANGRGTLNVAQLALRPVANRPAIFDYAMCSFAISFAAAQPYAIVSYGKSNLFHASSWDEIRYFPANITKEHVEQIGAMALALIVGLNINTRPMIDAI